MNHSTREAPSPILTGKRLLAVLGVWALASAAVAGSTLLLLRRLSSQASGDADIVAPILVSEVYAVLIGALVVVLRPRFREVVALRPCSALEVLLVALACVAAYVVIGALQGLITPPSWAAARSVLLGIGSDHARLASAGPLMAAVILVRACLLAPLGEELLFRGAMYTWLRRRLPAMAAISIAAAAFASIHGFPEIVPLAFACGVGFGWIRERSGSIVPAFAVHAVHNALLVAASYALTGWEARLPL